MSDHAGGPTPVPQPATRGDTRALLAAFLRNPARTGTIAPSSQALARAMIRGLTLAGNQTIVEFGPGTGPFTAEILRILPSPACYVGFEIEPRFVALLRARFPDLRVIEESAERAPSCLAEVAQGPVKAIVCSLPFASLPPRVQDGVIHAFDVLIGPGGENPDVSIRPLVCAAHHDPVSPAHAGGLRPAHTSRHGVAQPAAGLRAALVALIRRLVGRRSPGAPDTCLSPRESRMALAAISAPSVAGGEGRVTRGACRVRQPPAGEQLLCEMKPLRTMGAGRPRGRRTRRNGRARCRAVPCGWRRTRR